jgi:hypothetical protein
MGTQSFIGIETEAGKVRGVYCHWDGYVDGVGATLKEHYVDSSKINDLIALGSLSSLGPLLGEKHMFNDPSAYDKGWSTAYHRDRDEELVVAEYDDMYSIDGDYEYMYVYTQQGLWMYKSVLSKSPWLPLV